MGTKYIIEVEDKPFELLSEDGFTSEKLFRVKGFNSLVFDWNGLNMLTPYTEPDFEQVRKETYQQGYEQGYKDGYNEPGKGKIQVGDEVQFKNTGSKFVVTRIFASTEDSKCDKCEGLFDDGEVYESVFDNVVRTGRHFPEIAKVLAKMKEK